MGHRKNVSRKIVPGCGHDLLLLDENRVSSESAVPSPLGAGHTNHSTMESAQPSLNTVDSRGMQIIHVMRAPTGLRLVCRDGLGTVGARSGTRDDARPSDSSASL